MSSILSKRQFIICVIIFASSLMARAQGNLPYFDDKFIHFGFSLGFNTLDFGIESSQKVIKDSVYNANVSSLQPGFSVGIISDMRLARYLNLRFTPTLHFGSRMLSYTVNGKYKQSTEVSSIPINLPLYLKYSAERKDNYRPYLIFGGGIGYDLSTDQTRPVLLRPVNTFVEFGAGCDIYFSFFKLSPELKFALGFNNLLTPLAERKAGELSEKDQLFTEALSKLTSRMITLTFNFE